MLEESIHWSLDLGPAGMFLSHELLQTLRDDMCDLGSTVGERSGLELTRLTNRSSGLECKDGQSQVREWEHVSEIHEKLVELVRQGVEET